MSEQERSKLAGNGVALVREIALAKRVQRGLENLYRLDRSANVDDYVTHADEGEREALFVRETDDGLELLLRVPRLIDKGIDVHGAGLESSFATARFASQLDPICQIIEGVSHFVYLAHRASREQETTQLELELQAEVDKYVVLAASIQGFDERTSRHLRGRLYETVDFAHAPDTVEGERYRVANERAHRFTGRLERDFVSRSRYAELRDELRRFFHMSQGEKLRAA